MYTEVMNHEAAAAVITKAEAEKCRHRLEKRWYRRLLIVNILMIVAVIGGLVAHADKYRKEYAAYMEEVQQNVAESMLESDGGTQKADSEKEAPKPPYDQDNMPWDLKAVGFGIVMIGALYLATAYLYAKQKANAIRITENNFPEVYDIIVQQAKQLGMKKVPEVYIAQGGGVLNAFSSFILCRQYIVIHAEVFEVAYREHHDMDVLRFIIAHEMGHIYYRHATLGYNLPILFAQIVPILGTSASRAREYSCDRLAQRITGTDGIDSMMMLMVDRHLYKQVNVEDYLKTAAEQHGFFLWLSNLLADHPVACKRIPALARGEGSGALY